MMTIKEMQEAKERLHYTNEMISDGSGIPLPTVQKVLSGATIRPRYKTLAALDRFFRELNDETESGHSSAQCYSIPEGYSNMSVEEAQTVYNPCEFGKTYKAEQATPADEAKIFAEHVQLHPRYRITVRKQGEYTIDDIAMTPDDLRIELIDGVIYDLASPTPAHQIIAGAVYNAMSLYSEEHDGECMPFIAPLDIRLDNTNKTQVQPDVFVICAENTEESETYSSETAPSVDTSACASDDALVPAYANYSASAGTSAPASSNYSVSGDASYSDSAHSILVPDFIMEVLSPSTKQVDMLIKLNKYYEAGVREYWIVDPDRETITVYDFENMELNQHYTFNDKVPVMISCGELNIDFAVIRKKIETGTAIMRSRTRNAQE